MKQGIKSRLRGPVQALVATMLLLASSLPCAKLHGQSISGKSITELRADTLYYLEQPYHPFFSVESLRSNAMARPSFSILHRPASIVPADYNFESLGFFCKIEVDMARTIRFPVKMRLGEVHYVERMEGKKGYWPY